MRTDLATTMEPRELRATRLIGLALVSGAVLFAAVATALPFLTGGPAPGGERADAGTVELLSLVHGGLLVATLAVAVLASSRIAAAVAPGQPQVAYVLRWALVESPALFGSVVVLIAGQGGVLPAQPLFYANLTSTLVMATFVLTDLGRLRSESP